MARLESFLSRYYNINTPEMFDNPVIFEPTFTFMGLLHY